MSKRLFTAEEVEALEQNPNVFSVSPREIQYTNTFKEHFIERYLVGDGPTKIFTDAGFPVEVLGYKRIERASYHWRRAYEAGSLGKWKEINNDRTPRKMLLNVIREQQAMIRKLQKELSRARNKEGKSA